MTADEVKQAFFDRTPVIYKDIEYTCVSALIYRQNEKSKYIEAELYDKCGHSVTIVGAALIKFIHRAQD